MFLILICYMQPLLTIARAVLNILVQPLHTGSYFVLPLLTKFFVVIGDTGVKW